MSPLPSAYEEWLQRLVREHRHRQGHGLRHTGCWACDCLDVSDTDRDRCRELSGGIVDGDHLIQQQVLRREFSGGHRRVGLVKFESWGPTAAAEATFEEMVRTPAEILWDPRVGVPMRRWHHDARHAGSLRIPRVSLPHEVEEFAAEFGVDWYLDRTYGRVCHACGGSGVDRSGGGLGELCPVCRGRR